MSLAVLALGVVAAQAEPISFAHRAASLETVLDALSTKTGKVLVADKALEKEIALINVRDQESQAILDRLAETFSAEWKPVTLNRNGQSIDALRLTRTTQSAQAAANAEVDARVKAYASSLETVQAELKKTPEFNEAKAQDLMDQFQTAIESARNNPAPGGRMGGGRGGPGALFAGLMNQSPGARAVAKALAGIDLKLIATMPAQSRIVFSTVPTLAQRRLGGNALEAARSMVREDKVMRDAMDAGGMRMMFGGPGAGEGSAATGEVTAAMLVITRFGGGDAVNVSFVAANQQGQALSSGNMLLGFTPEPETEAAANAATGGEKKTITLSADAVGMARLLAAAEAGGGDGVVMQVSTGGAPVTVTPSSQPVDANVEKSLLDKIANPDKYDPLSFTAGEMIDKSAVALGQNVIAWMPDTLFSATARVGQGNTISTALVVNTLKTATTVKSADGWWMIVPNRPLETIAGRLDRVSLKSFLATLRTDGWATLDSRATYVAAQPRSLSAPQLESTLISAVNPGEPLANGRRGPFGFGGGGGVDRTTLRFYGTLPTSLRDRLKSGGSLPINVLTGVQLAALNDLVFASPDGPQRSVQVVAAPSGGNVVQPNAGRGGRGARGGGASVGDAQGGRGPGGPGGGGRGGPGFGFGGNLSMADERTYVLGNGLPKTGVVTAQIRDEIAVMGRTAAGTTRMLDTGELAMNRLASEGTPMPFGPRNATPLTYTRYKEVTDRTMRLTFQLQPDYAMSRTLSDVVVPSSAMFVGFDQLSSAFRDEVNKAYNDRKEMMNRMNERGPDRARGGPGNGRARSAP